MMGGYRYKENAETIDKNKHSHVAEALQYLALHINAADGAVMTGVREVVAVNPAGWV
jgi:hypothetical protein